MTDVPETEHTGGRLESRIAELRARLPDLKAVTLATRSGLLVAADVDDDLDADALAALGADLLASSQAAARALAGGEPREVTVRGPRGHVIAVSAGDNAVLIAMTDVLVPPASVLPDLREVAQALAEMLAE